MNLTNFKQISNFIVHNNKKFKKYNYENQNLILIELFNFKPSTTPYSYLSNILSFKHKANIYSLGLGKKLDNEIKVINTSEMSSIRIWN